jgi:hypothetical protein
VTVREKQRERESEGEREHTCSQLLKPRIAHHVCYAVLFIDQVGSSGKVRVRVMVRNDANIKPNPNSDPNLVARCFSITSVSLITSIPISQERERELNYVE